jgi:hypothetical protein
MSQPSDSIVVELTNHACKLADFSMKAGKL